MKTKRYNAYPTHKTGYTREQHDFHKRVVISGYDTFRGWGEEYERGTCLIYGTPGIAWEFVLPNGLTLEDYVNYYERLTYDSFKVTREGYSACVITQAGVLPLVKWWTEADEDLQVKSFHRVEDARAFLETL